SYPDFVDLRDGVTGVTLTGWVHGTSKIKSQTPGTQSQDVATLFVSRNYFPAINVKLAQGPGFGTAATPEVIVGHEFWQKQLGSDPQVVARPLTLNGVPHLVVGIAPHQFFGHLGLEGRELFVPIDQYPPFLADNAVRTDRANEWIH